MQTKSTRTRGRTKKGSATKARYFRTFLLMQQFAPDQIGARIAQARREADGMTQETLADALDLSVRQLQNIEAGATIPWKQLQPTRGDLRQVAQLVPARRRTRTG